MDYIITAIVLLLIHSTYGVQVRLVDGTSSIEGRVEVYYNNKWGTICDDHFSTNDAGVICSMLGFERDGAIFFTNAYFGEGTGQIWLDHIKCEGSESSIENCIGSSWGAHNCHHSEDVGVRCRPKLEVRLVGGKHYYEGRIEVLFSGTWGTVCDDFFDALDAQVLCHMLGFKSAGAVAKTGAYFGPGSGKIWLDDLGCTGSETSVGDCSRKGVLGCHNCNHGEDAGIVCRPGKCQALSSVTNGRYSPDSCTTSFRSAGFACSLICNTGYTPMSINTTTCFDTGAWSHQISCADIDECQTGESGCTQLCTNVEGSYMCSCNDGYLISSDGKSCSDIDECQTGESGCTQLCTNVEGSYMCSCNDGYLISSDGKSCSDIDECQTGESGCAQLCTNVEGSFICSCNDGYQISSDSKSCSDIDECALDTSKCTQQCINTDGSFECKCNEGYMLKPDKRTCEDAKYRIHIQYKEEAASPAYVILGGNVSQDVKLALGSSEKLEKSKLYKIYMYNATGVNVGEIADISLPDNTDVSFVSVHNPYTHGYYIQRFQRSHQVIKGKVCNQQFEEDLNTRPDYSEGLAEAFPNVKDIIDCKLLCIEKLNFNFTCQMVHFNDNYGCNVLEKTDIHIPDPQDNKNIVSKRKGKC